MQSMEKLTAQARAMMTPLTENPGGPLKCAEIPRHVIDRLFTSFADLYKQRFLNEVQDVESEKQKWAIFLSGLTGKEIARGLHACLTREYPPNPPAFRNLCRPPRDPETEFIRAANILARYPIDWHGDALLYAAVRKVGAFDVRSRPYEGGMKARWTAALREAETLTVLPELPVVVAGQITQQPTPRPVAREKIAAIKALLTGGENASA